MNYSIALSKTMRIHSGMSGETKSEYGDGLIDLLYEMGLAEMIYSPSNGDAIDIANRLIRESKPEECIYRSVMTDFILLVGTEDEDN